MKYEFPKATVCIQRWIKFGFEVPAYSTVVLRWSVRGGVIRSILSFSAISAIGRCDITLPIGQNSQTMEKDCNRPWN